MSIRDTNYLPAQKVDCLREAENASQHGTQDTLRGFYAPGSFFGLRGSLLFFLKLLCLALSAVLGFSSTKQVLFASHSPLLMQVLVGEPGSLNNKAQLYQPFSRGLGGPNPVIDGCLFEELQYTFECRRVNRAVLPEGGTVLDVYELLAVREASTDQWVYDPGWGQEAAPVGLSWTSCWETNSFPPPSPVPLISFHTQGPAYGQSSKGSRMDDGVTMPHTAPSVLDMWVLARQFGCLLPVFSAERLRRPRPSPAGSCRPRTSPRCTGAWHGPTCPSSPSPGPSCPPTPPWRTRAACSDQAGPGGAGMDQGPAA